MDCEQVMHLISAELDSEISAEDRTGLEMHLAGCDTCRATAQALRLQDAAIRRAFVLRREAATEVADRVIAALPSASPRVAVRFPAVAVALSAAAGFLLAVLVFRPWLRPAPQVTFIERAPGGDLTRVEPGEPPQDRLPDPPLETTPEPRTQLVFAKGTIEAMPPGSGGWLSLPTGAAIAPGTHIRTDTNGRCEFRTPDGSEVRLNGNTEVVFETNRRLALNRGQMWSSVAEADDPFEVQVTQAEAKVTALGTQFDIATTALATLLTVVQGTTRVDGKTGQTIVPFGEQAKIVAGEIAERRRVHDLVVTTSWVHEILVLKGHDNEELARRMDDMLAQIGKAKMHFMYEKEILQLGDHCVLPLTRFIQSEHSRLDKSKRVHAARILAKIARPWSIRDLISLLADDDAEVRVHAARALERLTDGIQHGLAADRWRDASAERRQNAIERWTTWWEEHKDVLPESPFSKVTPDLTNG